MSWLLPGFLAGSLLIGLPLVLHFLRHKPKTVVRFPTLRFLAPTAIRDTRSHRLRRLLTLLLRCLVIALLAAAFARPFFADAGGRNASVVVVAVDNSMSVQALGRWRDLQNWALAELGGLRAGDQAGVLLMHPSPVWLVPVSEDLSQVRAALQEMEPGFEATRYLPALRMAGEALSAIPARSKTLLWVADEQRLGWLGTRFDEPLPPGVKVRFAAPALAPDSQAAITSLRRSRDAEGPALEVKVKLFSPDEQTRRLTVKAGGASIAEQRVTLTGREVNSFRIPLKIPSETLRGGLAVSLNPDDLAADDTAWIPPLSEASRTILFGPGAASHFLGHALDSLSKLDANDLGAQPFPDGAWPAGSVAIATGECFLPPLLDRLDRFAEAGGALWIIVDGSPAQSRWLAERGVTVRELPRSEEPAHLRDWDLEHPILAAFSGQSLLPLMEVEFLRGFALEGEALTSVANWSDGSAGIAEWNAHGRRAFLTGFPLDRSATNWPVQPSFVPFVHQTARSLAALGQERSEWRVGDTIPLPGEGIWRVLDSPRSGPEKEVAGSVRPAAPGLYEFFDGNIRAQFAVNTPVAESDLAPWPDPAQFASLESKAEADRQNAARFTALKLSNEAAESQQRLWWWLLAVCAAAMLAELALANRTAL